MTVTTKTARPVRASAKSDARNTLRETLATSAKAWAEGHVAQSGKSAEFAAAMLAAHKGGISGKELDATTKRQVTMVVCNVSSEAADKLLARGAKRSKELDTALAALRQIKSRAIVVTTTGAGSVRKARAAAKALGVDQRRKGKGKAAPAAAPAPAPAAAPAGIIIPKVAKISEVRAFLVSTRSQLERSLQALAKAYDADTRAACVAAIAALKAVKIEA